MWLYSCLTVKSSPVRWSVIHCIFIVKMNGLCILTSFRYFSYRKLKVSGYLISVTRSAPQNRISWNSSNSKPRNRIAAPNNSLRFKPQKNRITTLPEKDQVNCLRFKRPFGPWMSLCWSTCTCTFSIAAQIWQTWIWKSPGSPRLESAQTRIHEAKKYYLPSFILVQANPDLYHEMLMDIDRWSSRIPC